MQCETLLTREQLMNFTGYNTDTLAYKLVTGKLRRNRKHSEQLNKYLAGMIDTDGCISLFFYKTRTTGKQKVSVVLSLSQSAKNDPDFEVMRSLQSFYGLGSLYYQVPEEENETSTCMWTLRDKDAKILYNRLSKHLRLKGTHYSNMVWVSESHQDIDDIPEGAVAELKEYRECSLKNTTYLKMPKHLSWAYVAGVVAGDGCIRLSYREGRNYPSMRLKVTQSSGDKLLKLFKRDFKGSIYPIRTWFDWERNLGISDASFAVPFLKNIRKYIIHKRKYDLINDILQVHEEHRQQRLNRGNP